MVWAILNPEQNAALKEIVDTQSDRVAAILGGAMLDDSLRRALEHRLRPHDNINDKLFRVTGALGNTVPKIDLAFLLYMFEKPVRNTMYGIAEVRNCFAHNMSLKLDDDYKRLNDAFSKMTAHVNREYYTLPNGVVSTDLPIEPTTSRRAHYVVSLKLCLIDLMADFNRHQPHSCAV